MKRLVRLAAAAAITIAFVVLVVTFLETSVQPVYAVEQTVEAFGNVRHMHIIRRDKAGNTEDERWIEIDPNGFQARYRQDTPERSFYVVDDRQTVLVHYADKNTAVLYDPNDRSWTWHYAPGKLFEQLAAGGTDCYTVEENVHYKGRPAHHLRRVVSDEDIYIDPQTKLPIALGDYEISYEDPPPGIFDVVAPDEAIVVDRRPGAEPTQEPQWMIEERKNEQMREVAQGHFEDARRALAGGSYAEAVEFFNRVVEIEPGRNWAWFWMGRAHYELGQYDMAIWEFTKVIDMFRSNGWDAHYCHLARGLAYVKKDMDAAAEEDIAKALPKMILALRNDKASAMFDLADDPLRRADGMTEGCHEAPTRQQSLVMMINRLRIVTGQNFGYNPDAGAEGNEQAIKAWEDWLEHSGSVEFSPEAELLPVAGTSE
ncbi:MAG: tetratricopeptide repeat protein [Planctomycetota bacterium]|jgi:hypothetical protein